MTNAELAILGLVAEEPRHGYEIERVIAARGMREWTEIGFSSIYYLLNKLQRQGLVHGYQEAASGRGPARKVYRISPEGRIALQSGLLETLSSPKRCYPPLQIGLANLPTLERRQVMDALANYRHELANNLEHIQERRASLQPLPYFVEAMFTHSQALIRAEMDWLDGFLERLAKQGD